MNRFRLFPLLLLASALAPAAEWRSGEWIPAGTHDQVGPLAAHSVMSVPVGTIAREDGGRPDVVVATTRHGSERGMWRYEWVETREGVPVFRRGAKLAHPFENEYPPAGTVISRRDGETLGLWLDKGSLVWTRLEGERFVETGRLQIEGLPRGAGDVGAEELEDGSWRVYLGVGDGVAYSNWKGSTRDPEYRPYDGAGIWQGGSPYAALYAVQVSADGRRQQGDPVRVSKRDSDVRTALHQITPVELRPGERGVMTGSHYGGLHYFAQAGAGWAPRRLAARVDGIAHRHPIIHARPTAYPGVDGRMTDLLAGGEGGVYYYRFTGRFDERGRPVYAEPTYALEADAMLYAGTLPVVNAVDWDADGDVDVVAGNSEGLVQFFENVGGNESPALLPGVPLRAGGEVIHVQPGYRQDIQGPGEARWGYVCPTVVDWNGDGLLDIVMSDSTARHHVYLNEGKPGEPKLASAHPLYFEGLDMHGTWRVKPAAARMGERMAYVALDTDDQFHLYWQEDAYNLNDGGKLRLESGEPIGANFIFSGGTGRLKITLTDWDRDGKVDLLVGTPRHGSVPDPEKGLPQSLGLPGSAVLVLKNTGTNEAPRFAFPKLMAFEGKPIFLGQHSCSPTPAPFRGEDDADLIVGQEDGRFRYFRREDLSLFDAKDFDPSMAPPRH